MRRYLVLFALLLGVPAWAGWLASGGTDFAYRQSFPVAHPATASNSTITVPFHAWFLKDRGKILQSSYQDVHVTKSDGTTELPCALDAAKKTLTVWYASMPQGRTTLYVYYGHASVAAPSGQPPSETGTLLDTGFEGGTSGNNLANPPWSANGSPTVRAYNHEYPNLGSMEAKITARAGSVWDGVEETTSGGMTDFEYRFWLRFDSATKPHAISDTVATAPAQCFYLRFNDNGQVQYYTDRGTPGYYQVGTATYTAGSWMQYRIVRVAGQYTYSLYRRASLNDSWTTLGTGIPFRGVNDTATNSGLRIQGYDGATLRVDDVRYGASIADGIYGGVAQALAPNDERVSLADTSSRWYVSQGDIEHATLDSANATTSYGGRASNALRVGVTSAGAKRHGLAKWFEGALPLGTVSSAKLWLYLESKTMASTGTVKAHKLKTTGDDAARDNWVKTGWTDQNGFDRPTWNTRTVNWQADNTGATSSNWMTAGAVDSSEVDLSDATAPSLSIATNEALGYKSITLPSAWMSAWAADDYSQGVLLKDSTETGSEDRFAQFSHASSSNPPVLEVVYSALAADQWAGRRLTTETYAYAATPSSDHFIDVADESSMGVFAWINNRMGMSVAYVSPDGRARIVCSSTAPATGRLHNNSPTWGIHYDSSTGRYWTAGNDSEAYLTVGVSDPYDASSWTWATHSSAFAAKGTLSVSSDVGLIAYFDFITDMVAVATYTRASATWSSVQNLAQSAVYGTERTLATGVLIDDVMAGAGVISLNGTPTDYPSFGTVKIDSELFYYSGKSGDTLTGVTRALFGTTAAAHSVGATVLMGARDRTYLQVVEDPNRACSHVFYTLNANPGFSNYVGVGYLRHNYADAFSVWRDVSGTLLSLPLTQATETIISDPASPGSFGTGSNILPNGDVLATYGTGGVDWWNDLRVLRLPAGSSTWTDYAMADDGAATAPFAVDGSDVKLFYSFGTTSPYSLRYVTSKDNGVTWGAPTTLYSRSFPNPASWFYPVGASRTSAFSGRALVYVSHFAAHGAIWLSAIWIDAALAGRRSHQWLSPVRDDGMGWDGL